MNCQFCKLPIWPYDDHTAIIGWGMRGDLHASCAIDRLAHIEPDPHAAAEVVALSHKRQRVMKVQRSALLIPIFPHGR